jgi:hypothetical protein
VKKRSHEITFELTTVHHRTPDYLYPGPKSVISVRTLLVDFCPDLRWPTVRSFFRCQISIRKKRLRIVFELKQLALTGTSTKL